jgi:hypothetical protein
VVALQGTYKIALYVASDFTVEPLTQEIVQKPIRIHGRAFETASLALRCWDDSSGIQVERIFCELVSVLRLDFQRLECCSRKVD